MSERSVIIIGGGIIGLTTAYVLAEQDFDVTVLEKQNFANEASWAGAGMLFIYPHFSAYERQLAKESLRYYPNWCHTLATETGIDPEFQLQPTVIVDPIHANEWITDPDICAQVISQSDIKKNLASLHIEHQALITHHSASVRNPRLLKSLMAALKKRVRLISHTEVLHIEKNTPLRVHTATNTYTAQHVIISNGAWAQKLLASEHVPYDIKPIRGQMVLFKPDKPLTPTSCMIVGKHGMYLVPRKDGLVLAGATVEDVGFHTLPEQAAFELICNNAYSLSPDLKKAPIIATWTGLRPFGTPSPYIQAIAPHSIYAAVGHYRNGLCFAPATAMRLSTLIQQKDSA